MAESTSEQVCQNAVAWEASYTSKVVTQCELAMPLMHHWGLIGCGRAMRAAINLLKQYHRDLHLPYEQRDAARKELHHATALLRKAETELAQTKAQLATVSRTAAAFSADLLRRDSSLASEEAQAAISARAALAQSEKRSKARAMSREYWFNGWRVGQQRIAALGEALRETQELLAAEQACAMKLQETIKAMAVPPITIPKVGSQEESLRCAQNGEPGAYDTQGNPIKFFRCNHHPFAIDNHFHGIKACEHGCQNDPPQWWTNGVSGLAW